MNKLNYINMLRSAKDAKINQARLFLREGTRYCALGLLCEAYRKAVGGEWVGPIYDNQKTDVRPPKPAFVFKTGDGDRAEYSVELPSSKILKWAGLSLEEAKRVQELNDERNLSFREIAEEIK